MVKEKKKKTLKVVFAVIIMVLSLVGAGLLFCEFSASYIGNLKVESLDFAKTIEYVKQIAASAAAEHNFGPLFTYCVCLGMIAMNALFVFILSLITLHDIIVLGTTNEQSPWYSRQKQLNRRLLSNLGILSAFNIVFALALFSMFGERHYSGNELVYQTTLGWGTWVNIGTGVIGLGLMMLLDTLTNKDPKAFRVLKSLLIPLGLAIGFIGAFGMMDRGSAEEYSRFSIGGRAFVESGVFDFSHSSPETMYIDVLKGVGKTLLGIFSMIYLTAFGFEGSRNFYSGKQFGKYDKDYEKCRVSALVETIIMMAFVVGTTVGSFFLLDYKEYNKFNMFAYIEVGLLVLYLTIYIITFVLGRKEKARLEAEEARRKQEAQQTMVLEEPAPYIEPAPVMEAEPVREAAPVMAAPMMADPEPEPIKEEPRPVEEAPKPEKKKEEKPAKEEAPEKKEVKYRVYHVVKRKEDGKWEVKYAGGQKAIKLFDTQKEAIEYSKKMAENQGGSVLIHNSKGANKGRIKSK